MLEERKVLHLPPFSHHMVCHIQSRNIESAEKHAQQLFTRLQNVPGVCLLPPFESALYKRQGHYKLALVAQADRRKHLYQLILNLQSLISEPRWLHGPTRYSIDLDPLEI